MHKQYKYISLRLRCLLSHLATFCVILLFLMICGCTNNYYRAVDGTDALVGISLPEDSYVQINAFHYLNGQKTTVRDVAKINHEYEMSETNSYFGVIKTQVYRKSKIEVEPVDYDNITNTIPVQSKVDIIK